MIKNFSKIGLTAALLAVAVLTGCNDDKNSIDLGDYQDWRKANDAWVSELQTKTNSDGTPYYEIVVPTWNPGGFVLMHWFNDRAETAGNLIPLYTSTVNVIYEGYTKDDEMFDSSKSVNLYGRTGVQQLAVNRTIQGWAAAMERMHVGDTCEIIVPYAMGYGSTASTNLLPYTALRFNLRLTDIVGYESRP